MKISYQWLKELSGFSWSPRELADKLTLAGAEVEFLEAVGADHRLHVEVTSNRPDWNGHLGLAREVAALRGIVVPPLKPSANVRHAPALPEARVDVEDRALCPRYVGTVIVDAKVGDSPAWLKQRLETLGIRCVNNVVDATNYVMMLCNQPLHAFDLDKLEGRRVVVRRAVKGETMKAIDNREYALTPDMLVIADGRRPAAIAGVMGGADSEIGGTTKNILLECAVFQPRSVRATARALQLHSDSSHRFERGVDGHGCAEVAAYAAALIAELTGGVIAGAPLDVNEGFTYREESRLKLTFSGLRRTLGIEIGLECVAQYLQGLGFGIEHAGREGVFVSVPSWRRDVQQEIDLVEEVIRLHGFHHLPSQVHMPVAIPSANPRLELEGRLHLMLTGGGFYECVTDSFALNALQPYQSLWADGEALTVRNPIRAEQSGLRRTLLPSLLEVKRNNENFGTPEVRLYEIARAYFGGDDIREMNLLGMVADVDPARLKGLLAALLDQFHVGGWEAAPRAHALLDSGCVIRAGGTVLGYYGVASRRIVRDLELKRPPAMAELDLDALLRLASLEGVFTGVNHMPRAQRDLAVIVDEAVTWRAMVEAVRAAGGPLLRDVEFFDLYRGKPIPAGSKSLAFRLTYQAADRTLESAEVETLQGAIVAELGRRFQARLRQ